MSNVLTPRKGLKWKAEATAAILKLEAGAAYRAPLTEPTCAHDDPPGLVTRQFHFTGKGRDIVLPVRCHAKVMVGLLKALRKCPSIQVTASSTSVYSGSYRSWGQQNWLRQEYLAGRGHRAADPCYGYHRRGRALDLRLVTDEEREAMLSVRVRAGRRQLRFYDLLPIDPPHFTLGARG
jgi:hypothetical protein